MLDSRGKVSIVELIIYIPCLPTAVWLCICHGFGRSSGWIYLIIFTLVRLVGPYLKLRIESDPTDTGLSTTGAILQTVGLSPLLLTALGLLSRV